RICERLDGIPLAIELAAARCRQMSPDRIADQLENLFGLLTGGHRMAVARQRTLLASIEWSHDLLEPLERIALRRLGIFTGSFDLEAAQCVVADPGGVDQWSVMDLLGRLVDKNLLIAEPEDRYRLLQTMRHFALDQLNSASEVAVSRNAHLRWFHDRLRENVPADGTLTDLGARWLTVHHDNLVTALDWAAAHDLEAFVSITDRLHSFWYLTARQGECSTVVGTVLETLAAQGRHDVRAHLLSRHAMALALAGHRTGAGTPVLDEVPAAIERCFAADDPVSACWGAYAVKLADIGTPFQFADLAVVARQAGSTWAWFWQAMAARITRVYFTAHPFDGLNADDLRQAEDFARHHQATRILLAAVVGTEQVMQGDLRAAAETLYPELDNAEQQPAVGLLVAGAAGCVALMTSDDDQLHAVLRVMAVLARTSQDAAKAHRLLQDLSANRDDDGPDYRFSYWDLSLPPMVNLLHWLHIWSVGSDGASWSGTDPHSSRGVRVRLTDSVAAAGRGQWSEALTLAHTALAGAADSRLGFLVVDAIETLASLESRCGDRERGALLLGAAERRREEIGYRLRFPVHQAALRPLFELSAQIELGRGVDITRAVEVAGRARGERHRPRIGPDSLTPTELHVAQLARGGLTNSQIAAEMVISAETVKTHLKHINGKLDIRNRTQLAAIIPPP
ncbi:MAG: LuxR C-terminal-related transcriptional regulator, partial [Nakamurella sp.]